MDETKSGTNQMTVSVPSVPVSAPDDKPPNDEKPTSLERPPVCFQKGETSKNLDFEFAATDLKHVYVWSYDIGCAWHANALFASAFALIALSLVIPDQRVATHPSSSMSSDDPYRCDPPFYADPSQPTSPVPGSRVYLVCGRNVKNPGVYSSWPSADAEYKGVSDATLKGYTNWGLLRSAWYARCDLGEHSHPANPNPITTHAPSTPVSSSRLAPMLTSPMSPTLPVPRTPSPSPSPPPRTPSPPLQTYAIDSRSPSPVAIPSGSSDPPAYPAGETVYAVRVGMSDGEIFTRADEARARFLELRSSGRNPRLAVSPSVDQSLAWIDGTFL
ncbi:hypothetical protein B0H11DRAFT_2248575 [Mycena galericulata]|nr:hypothetical protein B0H11DRAFT_2248575 [Mycena galericulata]